MLKLLILCCNVQDKAKVLADVRGIIATQLGTEQEKVMHAYSIFYLPGLWF